MRAYITADVVGAISGGGHVTRHEYEALKRMGDPVLLWDRNFLSRESMIISSPDHRKNEPWIWDEIALSHAKNQPDLKHAHFYAGTFTKTIEYLRSKGVKVSYTCAAHSIEASIQAHSDIGCPYPYTHMSDPTLWKEYFGGYCLADLVIVPSHYSEQCLRVKGLACPVEEIPHGIDPYQGEVKWPEKFTVGYLGATGPDKGLIWLFRAWEYLNKRHPEWYRDCRLVFAGKQSQEPWMQETVKILQGEDIDNIELWGWQDSVSDFYNQISLLVVPSSSEGFNIEIIEAMAHGKLVVASVGAGAAQYVPPKFRASPRNYESLVTRIMDAKPWTESAESRRTVSENLQAHVKDLSWEKVEQRYVNAWERLDKGDLNATA